MLARARDVGVKRFIVPGTTAASWQATLDLASSHADIFPCLGLHPYFIEEHCEEQLADLEQLLEAHPEVVAIGEAGLDYWHSPTAKEKERQWFFLDAQLKLAQRFNRPVVLHVRKAMDEVIQRLRQLQLPAGGLLHAFSGSLQQAEQLVQLGFKLGLGGALTYPRAKKLRQVAAQLPESALLLETDSPDMPLQGRQGQRNEPAYLPQVFQVLVELRHADAQSLARRLETTAADLFQLQ